MRAGYKPIIEQKPAGPMPTISPPEEKEPAFAYAVEYACEMSLYSKAVEPHIGSLLGKTAQESRLSQWRQVANGPHTRSVVSIDKQETQQLWVGSKAPLPVNAELRWADIIPQDKDHLTIEYAFVPIRPAIQIGEMLGLPTEGYLYHFIDGELLHEYRFQGDTRYHFLVTQSTAGAMNPEPRSQFGSDFVLALWKREGQVVVDQHLLFSRDAMDDQAMSAVDTAFLNEHGVQLDMDAIIPLTKGPVVEEVSRRAAHKAAQGETLEQIAQQHGVSLETLQTLNPTLPLSPLDKGAVIYTEPVRVYNHALDVGYPAFTARLSEGLLSIDRIAREKPFPVVKVATANQSAFAALAPVRYAIDNRDLNTLNDEAVKGLNPITDTTLFPGGVLRSDKLPYTLRQLRDGWLYALSQDPETDAWSVAEYQVIKGEFYRFVGDLAETRYNAVAEKPHAYVLYQTGRPYFIGYASQRWTQNLQDFYTGETPESQQARQAWLRDITAPTHRLPIEQISKEVADVGKEDLSAFYLTCASPTVTEADDQGLITPLRPASLISYQYQAPLLCAHHFVALDDPLADFTDLYLRLAQAVLPLLQDDHTQRKTVVAEAIRSLVRISLPPGTLDSVPVDKVIEVEQDLDTCLEYHYYQAQLKNGNAVGNWGASLALEAQPVIAAYPKARARLNEYGIAPALLESRFREYVERRKAHRQVNWADLDTFYKDYLNTRHHGLTMIKHDAPHVIKAISALGTDPRRFGLDVGEHAHHLVLSTLMDAVLNELELSAQQVPELSDSIDELLIEPDNLLGLAVYGFSSEIYAATDQLLKGVTFSDFTGQTRIPLSGFISAFNDVIGFSDPNSALFTATKSLLIPLERQINQATQAVKDQGDKAVRSLQMLRFRIINRVMKLPGLSARRAMAMSLWGQAQLSQGKVFLNQGLSAQTQAANARYHQLLMEAHSTNIALSKLPADSPDYRRMSTSLRGVNKQISRYVESIPPVFSEYRSQTVGKYTFSNAASSVSHAFDRLGGTDLVVASLNLINITSQIQTLQEMEKSAPYPDTCRQQTTVGYSIAWFVNNTGAVLKGLSLSKIQGNAELMESSLKILKTNKIKGVEAIDVLNAERYIAQSLIAGVAGVLAAGLEGWQVVEDYSASKSTLEKALLGAKAGALGIQAVSWGGLVVNSLRTRLGLIFVGEVLQGWMLAINFWGAALYAAVTILLLLTKRTPLETWLRHSIWGKEPDFNRSAVDEYHALLALLNQPSIQFRTTARRIDRAKSSHSATVHFKQEMTILLPNAYDNEAVTLSIESGFPPSDYQNFTAHTLFSGQVTRDKNEPTLCRYHLLLPQPLQHLVAQGQGTIRQERLNVFVGRHANNPYDNGNALVSVYQAQTLAGVSEHKTMPALAESKLSLMPTHQVQLRLPPMPTHPAPSQSQLVKNQSKEE
ncbi:MAG: LysM peptidoglycan-binding domain-containing protein [Vibrio sp.]|uniref:LysM peptidoglycan-binding domain-containing protein n=2 Tax=Vibrio TaxID=662 RepID=UPI001ECB4C22|nr:LysM peptidoglycan-binding domain-containing protein [Vibrio sp.]NRB67345.1 LysM peptidoglycan-binding domain-containing protein [Vibrio sp.]